jgi:cytochrome c biogenesis protein CcmG, thiol:disulfide interchange protein DsbE
MPRVAVTILAVTLAACAAPRPVSRTFPNIGQPVEVVLDDISGRRVDVAADEGKVRVVDFWATWCEPCRDALPFLDALQRTEGPRGLSVYAVTFDEDPSQVKSFLEAMPLGIRILWDKGGMRLSVAYDVQRLPTTLIVDRRGILRYVHEGFDEEIARETRAQVERLLAEPRPTAGIVRDGPEGSSQPGAGPSGTSVNFTRSRSWATSPGSAGLSRSQKTISSASHW